MFVVESTNIFPLRTRFDIFSCFGWDWKLCFDVCKMSVTSTAIAKLCYKTSSKKFAIQYFLWLIAGWILTGSYNFFKSFDTIFKSVCKGNINCFGKPFWERVFFCCTTTWFLTLGHVKNLTFSTVSDNFQYFAWFPVFSFPKVWLFSFLTQWGSRQLILTISY